MTGRPTPEEIIDRQMQTRHFGRAICDDLREHGYVIVHPDDIPERPKDQAVLTLSHQENFKWGWGACRSHIFGDDR